MRYRAETLSGTVQVDRSAAGGSLVTCIVPVEYDSTQIKPEAPATP
jgi:hypothetical protein